MLWLVGTPFYFIFIFKDFIQNFWCQMSPNPELTLPCLSRGPSPIFLPWLALIRLHYLHHYLSGHTVFWHVGSTTWMTGRVVNISDWAQPRPLQVLLAVSSLQPMPECDPTSQKKHKWTPFYPHPQPPPLHTWAWLDHMDFVACACVLLVIFVR